MVDPTAAGRPGPGRRARPLLRTMVGDVLRRTRLAQRRTLADVARAARISMPYLSELERGRKEASSEILAAICDALRLDLADLLASVERELASDRIRRALVIPLDAARYRRGSNGAQEVAVGSPGQAESDSAPSQLLTREADAGQAHTGEQPRDVQPAVPAGEQPSSEWLIVRIGPAGGLPGGLGSHEQRNGGIRPGDVVCRLAA